METLPKTDTVWKIHAKADHLNSDRTACVWPAELSGHFARRDVAAVNNQPVSVSGPAVRFGDLFEIDEPPAAEDVDNLSVHIRGDLSCWHHVGCNWSDGQLVIGGSVGDFCGESMSGGALLIRGDAGSGSGRAMSGGRISIDGNAGGDIGGPGAGGLKGMTGGEIFIAGDATGPVGMRMRRGTIAIAGTASGQIGPEMLAGTILLGSVAGVELGNGMKRGTIVILEAPPEERFSTPHFDYATTYEPVFLRVLLRHLQHNFAWSDSPNGLEASYNRFSGDMLEGGRGEILVRVTP